MTGTTERHHIGPARRAAGVSLIAMMAFGSAVMWIGCPVFWLWFASHLQQSSQPSLGPYLLVIIALPISMAAIGKALAMLDRYYATVLHRRTTVHVRLPWHRSMRDARDSGHGRTVLDIVMVVSVIVAGAIFAVWFFAFAGTSLPS